MWKYFKKLFVLKYIYVIYLIICGVFILDIIFKDNL